MSKYHFEEDDKDFGQTVRIDNINEQVKNYKRRETEIPSLEPQEEAFSHFRQAAGDTVPHTPINEDIKQNMGKSTPSHKPLQQTNLHSSPKHVPQKKRTLYSRMIFVFVILSGVIIFSVVFFMVFHSMSFASGQTPTEQPVDTPIVSTEEKTTEVFALVKNANTSNELSLYDVKSHTNFFVKADAETKITGRNQEKMFYSDIKIGDVIRIKLDSEKKKALSIAYCDECYHKAGAAGLEINQDTKTITIDGSSYGYTEETIVKYNNKLMNIQDLEPIDVVTVNGYEKNIWSIMIEKYHGYLLVKNKDKIQNGTITVDSKKEIALAEKDQFPISSGAHTILINGTNIEPYTTDIYVTENEKFEIDMSNMQTKTGVIVIKANINEYQLFVNEEAVSDPSAPLVLPQGEYQLKITKEGYQNWEQKVTIKEPSMEVVAEVKEEIKKLDLSITTTPAGCTVFLDDKQIGTAPLSAQIPYGEHRFTFKKEGYYDLSIPLKIDETTKPLSVTLNQITEANHY